jgi:hypothetical protein
MPLDVSFTLPNAPKSFSAGAPPETPLGGAHSASPDPLAKIGKGRGGEGKGGRGGEARGEGGAGLAQKNYGHLKTSWNY